MCWSLFSHSKSHQCKEAVVNSIMCFWLSWPLNKYGWVVRGGQGLRETGKENDRPRLGEMGWSSPRGPGEPMQRQRSQGRTGGADLKIECGTMGVNSKFNIVQCSKEPFFFVE